jgi:hypothetical protein
MCGNISVTSSLLALREMFTIALKDGLKHALQAIPNTEQSRLHGQLHSLGESQTHLRSDRIIRRFGVSFRTSSTQGQSTKGVEMVHNFSKGIDKSHAVSDI